MHPLTRYVKIKNKVHGSGYITTLDKAYEDMKLWLDESNDDEVWELSFVLMSEEDYKALPEFEGF